MHRDLKLENFLFEAKNSNSPLVLIDFGLSKHFEPDERLTQRVGSCYYTAPEVLNGKYDYRCDVWSLGVLCYMLLSGSPPFYGKTVDDVYAATLQQEAVFPDKKFKHVSGACMDFMRRLLVKDPMLRMTTAEALAHPFITTGGAGVGVFPTAHSSDGLGPLPAHVSEAVVQSMCAFMRADPLVKLILELVSSTLCPDHTRQFCDEFQSLDRLNNGTLTLHAFGTGLMNAPSAVQGLVDLTMLFNVVSISRAHGHGQLLTYHEYIAAAMVHRIELEDERIQIVFSNLDPGTRPCMHTRTHARAGISSECTHYLLRRRPCKGARGTRRPVPSSLLTLFLTNFRIPNPRPRPRPQTPRDTSQPTASARRWARTWRSSLSTTSSPSLTPTAMASSR